MTATPRAIELTEIAALAAADKLANDIVAYDVSDQLAITDAFLLCSGANDRQVRSIIDEVELKLKQAGATLVRREGENEGRWVLLDYNDLVVHVQNKEERVFYALERIWKDCPRIALPDAALDRQPGQRGRGVTLSAAKRLVLWRHGQTTWNVEHRFQGQTDIPLDETGEAQAEYTARRLATLRPDVIFSSDLSRAQQTAAALSKLTGLTVIPDKELRERFGGDWEGLSDEEIRDALPGRARHAGTRRTASRPRSSRTGWRPRSPASRTPWTAASSRSWSATARRSASAWSASSACPPWG